jgi:hypothetical protein
MALCNELLHCTIDGRIVMYNVMDSTDRCVSIYLLQICCPFYHSIWNAMGSNDGD